MIATMNGASFGGGTAEQTMSQILEEDVQQNFTYTLTADFGWRNDNATPSPPVLRLYAGATLLTPVTSVDPPLVKGGFVTYSRTYYVDDASISGPLRIEFGLAANTDAQQLNTDRIRLTKTPDDCRCDPGYFAVTTEINGETLITGCQPCPAGTYNSDEGAVGCTDCDTGFNSVDGAVACFPEADGDGIGDVCDACPTIPDPNCSSCGNNKYLVCHIPAGNPENAQQLCLPLNAANTHIGNHGGCFFGLCSPGSSSAGYSNNDNEVVETPSGAEESMFNISLEDHRFTNGIYNVSVFNNGENITKRLVVQK